MSMPAAAKRELQKAKEIHEAMYATEVEAAPDVEAPPVEAAPEPKAEEAPVVEAAPEPTPQPEVKKDKPTDWEQRYKSLQGKYNKEVPTLSNEVRNLQQLMASMSPPAPVDKPADTQSLLTEAEREDYGEDMLSVVRRAAQEALGPELARLKSENEQLRSHFGGVTENIQKSARQTLLDSLDRDLPKWKEINASDEFLDWLSNIDTYSGSKRHDLLLRAFEENDFARTSAFFRGYLNENAAVTSTAQAPDKAPLLDLDTLTAPGSPKSTGTPRAQEGSATQWTEREVSAFYADVTAGKFRGREKDKAKIEAQIIRAASEGRITP